MKYETSCYGELNVIESEFWGVGDMGEQITTVCSFKTCEGSDDFLVDIFVNDTQVATDIPLEDVGNELDSLQIISI